MRETSKKFSPIRFLVIFLVVSSLVVFCDAADAGIVSSSVEEDVEQLVTDGDVPSLHTCVFSGKEISWFRAYGEQTDPDTVFLIGSIQKVFTAISILQLYQTGRIGLDDDVNDYLPFSLRHQDYPDSNITIRMLLSHHSGLRSTLYSEFCFDWEGGYTPEYRPYMRGYYESVVGIPLGEYLAMCLPSDGSLYSQSNWEFEPGTRFGYSNTGYKILNYILELQTDLTIQEYMQENIFSPLRMNNTGFNASDFIGHHAIPYTRMYGNATNRELPVWNGRYMMRSTARDLGNLLIALMNDGQFGRFQMLEQDTLAMMFENPNPNDILKNLRKDFIWLGYGLGLEVRTHGILGHGGSTIGFTAEIYFNPTTDLGFVRLSNVNAILDSSSTEWQSNNAVQNEIVTLVMTDIGMLPTFDAITVILIVVSSITVVSIIYGIWRSRRK
ncbi:MAG: serine hydrolase domain-containing protein [Candidatus Thorarchaeota archaeon]|jgi:CubicO group peptidase (beta-lactamase class C family)